MRRLGVVAAGLAACATVGASLALGGMGVSAADPAPALVTGAGKGAVPRNLDLQLIMSRGHEVLTVVIQNRGPGPICIDPNYAAQVRLSAYSNRGKPIASLNPVPGRSKAACSPVALRQTLHVAYDLRPLYPLGLPGASRLCYGAWWRQGGPGSHAQLMQSARCLVLPARGLGRR